MTLIRRKKLDGIPLIDPPKDISLHAELQTIEEAKRGPGTAGNFADFQRHCQSPYVG